MAPTTIKSTETHQFLPLTSIDISKTNPRTHFDKGKLEELSLSVKEHGVIVPVLVRPKDGGKRFELIAGERRVRAAKMAKLDKIPAIVRTLSDKQALEIQVLENLQRVDLHPLEEAEGYATLIKKHGYDADSLAEKISKSRSYVYGRMKLAELCEAGKKALYEGKLTPSVALLIARIPSAELQDAAMKKLIDSRPDVYYGGRPTISGPPEPVSYRLAKGIIASDFQLRLKEAKFDTKDASLIPAAGACGKCPYRSGNQSKMFDDFDSADVCTLPTCYRAKEEASWQAEAQKKRGIAKIISLEQGKRLAPWGYVQGSSYLDVKSACPGDPQRRNIADLLPKDAKLALLRDGYGKEHKVIAKKDLAAEIARGGHKLKGDTTTSGRSGAAPRDFEFEDKIDNAVAEAMVAAIEAVPLDEGLELFLLRGALLDGDLRPSVFDRLDIKAADAFIATLDRRQLFAHLAESIYSREPFNTSSKPRQQKLMKQLGVDRKEIEKRLRAAKEEKPAKKAEKAAKLATGDVHEQLEEAV